MFENLIREMERLGREPQSISVPIESDEEGYLDKGLRGNLCNITR
jgi:hypothetical protein